MQLHEHSFGGFRLNPKPPTRWDEGSSSRCSRRQREAQSCQPISPAVQQYSLTPTASRKSTKSIKSTRLTIRRRTIWEESSRKKSSRKGPFSTGGIRLHKKWLYCCCWRLFFFLLFFSFVFFRTLLLSRFRTSRGHRCRPFSPSVLAFNFYRA